MTEIAFNYVGCNSAKENLKVAHNAWLSCAERVLIKHTVENGTEEDCAQLKKEMEKKLTDRVNASLNWY
jgi:hypothetical protein